MQRRKFLIAGAVTAAGAVSTAALAQNGATQSLPDRFAATLSAHDIGAFADLFSEDYVNHQFSAAAPAPAAGKSPKQASVDFFAARLAGMSDLQVAVETAIVTGDRIAASFVYTGTHDGAYLGVAPTHRRLKFTSCDIFTVKDGRLREHWGMGDIAGILAQLR
ncbi:ester cyclase [Bradyrhizobium sp. dw_78]|uniref:ester cyclase n=1 Tax=Bradyrhizobium sp. dw_78 TaxID=2719793 RepID=UPI001BD58F45|nr:ester cyclase [Bradyrhizobium sp. dw_78]